MPHRSFGPNRRTASVVAFITVFCFSPQSMLRAQPPHHVGGGASDPPLVAHSLRADAIAAIPLDRLTPAAQQRIERIVHRPTLYRRLPPKSIACDGELFLFIARNPEVLIGIWDLMGITQVKAERLDTYRLRAIDGSGTDCTVDLVYGDTGTHVYVADGFYDGKLTANPIVGKGVFVLRTQYHATAEGPMSVDTTLDCFLQFENLGADLLARTFGPLIGRTADNNFLETAKFLEQLGTTARLNPEGLEDLALRLPQVQQSTRVRFAETVRSAGNRHAIASAEARRR